MTLRDQVAAAADWKTRTMVVEEWDNAKIELRSPSQAAFSRFTRNHPLIFVGGADAVEAFPFIVIMCSFDPATGEKVFSDEDAELLSGKDFSIVQRIANEAMELISLSGESVDEAKKD